jgi:4-diphosphocytidyl-2-C-methyl-D-erythritol kinase
VAAKINLALVVGEPRGDGLHEIAGVFQRIDLCDFLTFETAPALRVEGFRADTLVRAALTELAAAAGTEPAWRVRLEKRIPLAAGLGGGSADAGAALALANRTLAEALPQKRLADVAVAVGADVPFFLTPGPKLVEGAGERLEPLDLPQDYWVVVALPRRVRKGSTGEVYARFDERGGGRGFEERRAALHEALERCRRPRDFAAFPANDLAAAAGDGAGLLELLRAAGAFRVDVSGAGPAVYGLFQRRRDAVGAGRSLRRAARVWVAAPVW